MCVSRRDRGRRDCELGRETERGREGDWGREMDRGREEDSGRDGAVRDGAVRDRRQRSPRVWRHDMFEVMEREEREEREEEDQVMAQEEADTQNGGKRRSISASTLLCYKEFS